MELNSARPFIATPCRVPRYKTKDIDIVKSTRSSITISSMSVLRCCSINDSSGCGAPLNSQGHRASRVPGRALTLRLAMGCREFSSVPKNNAQRLTANKGIACSVPSIYNGETFHCLRGGRLQASTLRDNDSPHSLREVLIFDVLHG